MHVRFCQHQDEQPILCIRASRSLCHCSVLKGYVRCSCRNASQLCFASCRHSCHILLQHMAGLVSASIFDNACPRAGRIFPQILAKSHAETAGETLRRVALLAASVLVASRVKETSSANVGQMLTQSILMTMLLLPRVAGSLLVTCQVEWFLTFMTLLMQGVHTQTLDCSSLECQTMRHKQTTSQHHS